MNPAVLVVILAALWIGLLGVLLVVVAALERTERRTAPGAGRGGPGTARG